MNFIKAFFIRRKQAKFRDTLQKAMDEQVTAFNRELFGSELAKDFRDLPVEVRFCDMPDTGGMFKNIKRFDTFAEAVPFISALRFEHWKAVSWQRIESKEPMTFDDPGKRLCFSFFQLPAGAPVGALMIAGDVMAALERQQAQEEKAQRQDQLKYLREECDPDYFNEMYLNATGIMTGLPFELTEDERAAALANPRIRHLVPPKR